MMSPIPTQVSSNFSTAQGTSRGRGMSSTFLSPALSLPH